MTKTTRFPRRLLCLLLALMLVASIFAGLTLTASGASYRYNWGQRDVLCTSLSNYAQAYYTGSYTYNNLITLNTNVSIEAGNSYSATQNNPLFNALYNLMSSTQSGRDLSASSAYNNLSDLFKYSDCENGDTSGKMRDFWCTDMYIVWNGTYLNREHVWQKAQGSYKEINGGSDLHHLRPANAYINQTSHNDKPYGTVSPHDSTTAQYGNVQSGSTITNPFGGWATSSTYEPPDNAKGDTARIFLFMYVRWQQPNLYTDVSSGNLPAMDSDDNQNNGTKIIESLDTLLAWCAMDPVDTWEMGRNDAIQSIQGNRNVFIDYPELAWYLFGKESEMPTDMDTPSGMAKQMSTVEPFTVTATTNNSSFGTVSPATQQSTGTCVITATPAEGYYAAAYDVTSGSATVTQNGNTFTVAATDNCTVQIIFAPKASVTLNLLAQGSLYDTRSGYAGDSVTLPTTATAADGWTFAGWSAADFADATSQPSYYAPGASFELNTTVTALYAVYTKTEQTGGASGYTLSTEAPAAGDTVILALKNGSTYYALPHGTSSSASWSGTALTLSDGVVSNYSNVTWSVESSGNSSYPVKLTYGDSKYFKINSSALAYTGNGDTGYFKFTASGSGFTMENKTPRYLKVNGTNFTYASASSDAGTIYVFKYTASTGTTTWSVNPTGQVHVHTMEHTAASPANCTTAGVNEYWYCSGCGRYFSDAAGNTVITQADTVAPALGHNYVAGTPVAATTTQQGYTPYTCSRCGDSYNADFTDPIGFVAEPGYLYRLTDGIANGDKIAVAINYNSTDYALSFENYGAALRANTVTVNGTILTPVNKTAILTVQTIGGDATVYYLVTDDGRYLTASSGSTLTLTDTPDATYSKWLPVAQDGSKLVLRVYAENLALQYYNGAFRTGVYNASVVSTDLQLSLYKRSVPETYTISFSVPGNVAAVAARNVTEGEATTLPTAEAPEGWTFLGWVTQTYDNVTEAPSCLTGSYTPTGSITLLALYTKSEESGTPTTTDRYVSTAAGNVTEGQYVIGALRSTTATNKYYFAKATTSSGDINTTDSTLEITGTSFAPSDLPSGAAVFTFAGDNTNGFTIAPTGTTNYLGFTDGTTARKLAFGSTYATTKWKAVAKDSLNANGLYLSCTSGTTYSISENSTAVGALRGYSTGTAYRGIYLFKLTSVTSGASTVTFYTTQFAGVCTHETLNATPYHAPTCTEPGNTAYWTCASCGKFFSDAAGTVEIDENSWILPATDHAYGAWTPNNDGTHSRVCAYDATHIETAACTFDDGAVTVAATYTAPGVKTYTCSVCGYSYTEAIPQLVYAESAAFKLTDMLTDGDKIVIYNPASGKALTSTLTGGYYLAGADATVNDTLLTAEDSAAVWTVKDNGDGTFSFVQDNGIALYGYISGSYVDLANTTGDGYVNKWVVNEVDSANHKFSMRCDGLSYTKSGTTYNSVYLEYFSNHFALYGNNNTLTVSDTAYLMQFYVLTAEVKGVSLTLNGNINTNAYLAIPDELVGDTLVAVVTYTDENGDTVTVSETALDPADKAPNGLYCFTAEMPAKDMNTKVRVTLRDGDGNPVPFLNSLGATVDYYEYSVQDYLKQVLETEADYYSANYPALVALCKTMRAYGYYAQLLFDYDTSNLVAPDANYLDGINVTATYTASVTKGTNVRFYGASLILRSQTAIRAYFVITGDASGYKAYIDGSTTGVELTQYAPGSRYYYVEVADIHARDLYQTHTIEVSNGTDSASLNNYSVYCYIARSVGDGDSLARLVKALWAYGEEARDYFS